MLVNLSGHKDNLDAIHGKVDLVTEHKTGNVLRFMDYQHDMSNYERRYTELINKR